MSKDAENSDNLQIPTRKNIEAILAYLPYFNNENNEFYDKIPGKKENNTFTMGYIVYSCQTDKFIHTAYNENFVQGFNWSKWQVEAKKIYKNPELLDKADIMTIVKYVTLIIRKERFCEGFLADMIDKGLLLKLLLRLKEIHE